MNDSTNNKDSRPNYRRNTPIFGVITRFLLSGVLFSVVFFAFGLGLLRLWMGPYIEGILTDENKLNSLLPSYIVEKNIGIIIGDAKIDWSLWLTPNLVLKNITVLRDSKLKILSISELESSVGLKDLISFFQKKTISNDIDIKETIFYLNKYQSTKETKLFLAGLPLLLSVKENNSSNFYLSPNELNIKKITLAYDNFNKTVDDEFVNLGSVKILNKPDQLRVFFDKLTTNSLLSAASIIGKLPKDYVRFEGLINSLAFKFPKNYK